MLQEIYAVLSAYMLPISVAVTGLTISAIYEIFFMKGWDYEQAQASDSARK